MKEKDFGYVRVASGIPPVCIADVEKNVLNIQKMIDLASDRKAQLLVLPELSMTGYTCADLFGSSLLLDNVEAALLPLAGYTRQYPDMTVIVGAPLRCGEALYNCAVVLNDGEVAGVVPKTYVPNYKEFYEKRWFTAGNAPGTPCEITLGSRSVPFGTDLIFVNGRMRVGIEICEDLWVSSPPSSRLAVNGANVLVNLSASNELIGKHRQLLSLIEHQSGQGIAAYVYSSAGYGESTTDLVFAGNAIIAENGHLLRESRRFSTEPQLEVADVDLEALDNERRVNVSFADCRAANRRTMRTIQLNPSVNHYTPASLLRQYKRLPFVPQDTVELDDRCEEIINIQTAGLMRRIAATGIKRIVVGISGGLDSTLALLVAVNTFRRMGLEMTQIHGITMPGFGTTDRTHTNAVAMMSALGVTQKEISIAAAVMQHFEDIGHDAGKHDVTYENSQARERTQILMDYANKVNALVLGTGDLSELALGWATYNGDHMSMYNVNASIPKTLARHLVRWFANNFAKSGEEKISRTLFDVIDTPISPELTPADSEGNIKQKTEELVGPYDLNDFFLYHTLRNGFGPEKVFFLTRNAFGDEYDAATVKHWLTRFYKRFFSQQFKRSCLPDGPKVGSVSLSPRGDWRMPSDVSSRMWIEACENLPEE